MALARGMLRRLFEANGADIATAGISSRTAVVAAPTVLEIMIGPHA